MHTTTAIVKSEMDYRRTRVRDDLRAARRARGRSRRNRFAVEDREIL